MARAGVADIDNDRYVTTKQARRTSVVLAGALGRQGNRSHRLCWPRGALAADSRGNIEHDAGAAAGRSRRCVAAQRGPHRPRTYHTCSRPSHSHHAHTDADASHKRTTVALAVLCAVRPVSDEQQLGAVQHDPIRRSVVYTKPRSSVLLLEPEWGDQHRSLIVRRPRTVRAAAAAHHTAFTTAPAPLTANHRVRDQ